MKIGIDARWIYPQISGVGRVTEKLIRHLGKIDGDNQYILLFNDSELLEIYGSRWETYPNLKPILIPWGIFTPGNQVGMSSLIRKEGINLFHSTNYMIPLFLGNIPVVSTIHDLIPIKFPHFTPRAKKTRFNRIFRRLLVWCIRRSDKVITVSGHTRDDLIKDLGIPPDKIAVVYNGIDDKYHPPDRANVEKNQAPKLRFSDPYLLYVGRFDPYKNVVGLIRSFRRFCQNREDNPRLVLAGHLDPRYPEAGLAVKELDLDTRVTFLDGVEEDELIRLYSDARILILPSFYEGFGLPPLEAMACGTPVIVSNRGSLPEVVGNAGLIVDPTSEDDIATAVEKLWDSESLRSEFILKGLKRAKDFSWEKTARETLKVYESLLK